MSVTIYNNFYNIVPHLKNKKIVLFGTSQGAQDVCSILNSFSLEVEYLVDNNPKKHGCFLVSKKITSPEELLKENKDDLIILIASMADKEISLQLEEMGFVKEKHFFSCVYKLPLDMEKTVSEAGKDNLYKSKTYTKTSIERRYSVYNSVQYIVKNNIQGDFVECGVWRGGSCMIMAAALMELGDLSRKIYLYDTYTGMSEPTEKDICCDNVPASENWHKYQREDHNTWCYASLEDVKNNILSTGYPEENIVFVKGKVEETIPAIIPPKIALLRLDTDWYESTYHELVHLYPLLVQNGVLIIDDYGFWQGAKQAVDEYFEQNGINLLLNRVDYTGRLGIKNV